MRPKYLAVVITLLFAAIGSAWLLSIHASSVPGDINQDNTVNVLDLSLLLSSYGNNQAACKTHAAYACDLNNDNVVNILDLSILLSNYGKTGTATGPVASSATLVSANCQPVWTRHSQLIFNRLQPNGHWDALIGDANCGNATALLPPTAGHRGASDVTPDGKYVLFETDYGVIPGQPYAEPGKGYHNDLELLNRTTGVKTRLTTGRMGTIWARINSTGTKVTWSQMLKTAGQSGNAWNYALGIWEIHVADITPQGTLTNERSWSQPNDQGFYETYGWYGNNIMFASDAGVFPKTKYAYWLGSQDWMIPDSLPAGSTATRISQPFPAAGGGQENAYNEFMHVTPPDTFAGDQNPWILTSIVRDANGGMDLWRMKPDGSSRERLTYFNGIDVNNQWQQATGYPAPAYSVVGGLAIDPATPTAIYMGVTHNINSTTIDCYKVQVK